MLKNFASKDFFMRVLSAVALVVIILLAVIPGGMFFSGRFLLLFNYLLSLRAVFELYRVQKIDKSIIGITGYLAVTAYYLVLLSGQDQYLFITVILFLIVILAEYVLTYPDYNSGQIAGAFLSMIYGGVLLSFLYIIRMGENGAYAVWLIFICSWISDTFAYLVGMAFGKHKMAPVLSPKKTVEGAVGGIAGAVIVGCLYAALFADHISMNTHPMLAYAVICGAGAVVSMIGDLAASAIKRDYSIKDYGRIIPGHGGVMDRFDSVIFVAPLVWVLLQIF